MKYRCAALLASLALVFSLLTVAAPQAAADPDAVAAARAALQQIEQQASAIDESYAASQAELADANKQLATIESDLTERRREVNTMSEGLGRLALMQYRQGAMDVTVSLLASPDDTSFLNDLAIRESVTQRAKAQLQSYQQAQAEVQVLQRNAATTKATLKAAVAKKASLVTSYDAKQAEAEKVLARLTAQERERLAEIERKQQLEAERRANAASEQAAAAASRSNNTSRSTERTSTSPTASSGSSTSTGSGATASGRAAQAVAFAKAQAGKSYRLGATGMASFDCSGLTGRAWSSAGVSLPRTSGAQFGVGTPISMSNLRPGDLVFYYSGISHVGMYMGNGTIVHAANPRSGVTYAPVNSMPFMGGRRVG